MARSQDGGAAGAKIPKGREVYAAAESAYPAEGPGSIATFGARLVAYVIDAVLSVLIAIAINGGYHVGDRQNLVTFLVFLGIEFVFITFFAQTPGMRAVGIGVVRADGQGKQRPQWVLVRTLLLAVVAPALVIDASGRAMHDRAAGTVMLRTR